MELFTASCRLHVIEVNRYLTLERIVSLISSPDIITYDITGLVATTTKILRVLLIIPNWLLKIRGTDF